MSTRGLLAIQCDGKYRLAQYLASDAYPSGAGKKILQFIVKIEEEGLVDQFKAYANRLHFDHGMMDEDVDCWPSILDDILEGQLRGVPDARSFAQDSMFCEWAYVLDLDRMAVECYKGWNEVPLDKSERFYEEGAKGRFSEYSQKTFYAVRKVGETSFAKVVMTSFDDILDSWKG